MNGRFYLLLIFVVAISLIAIFVGGHDLALFDPRGVVAGGEHNIIAFTLGLLLAVAIPTVLLAYFFAWHYRAKDGDEGKKRQVKKDEAPRHELLKEVGIWLIPITVIGILIPMLWNGAHQLDPYRPIDPAASGTNAAAASSSLTIQVVAMDWKWFFIYPQQHIATVNFVEFPAQTPINFELTAIDAPMNSFWIPQLGGQMYAMMGMQTPLHLMANEPGEYVGKNSEIDGAGYAGMNFIAKAVTPLEFASWIATAQTSAQPLTQNAWDALKQPSMSVPSSSYSMVDGKLFDKIVLKYMPGGPYASSSMQQMH